MMHVAHLLYACAGYFPGLQIRLRLKALLRDSYPIWIQGVLQVTCQANISSCLPSAALMHDGCMQALHWHCSHPTNNKNQDSPGVLPLQTFARVLASYQTGSSACNRLTAETAAEVVDGMCSAVHRDAELQRPAVEPPCSTSFNQSNLGGCSY